MHLVITDTEVLVREPEDFASFEVRTSLDDDRLRAVLASGAGRGWGRADGEHVWVSRDRIDEAAQSSVADLDRWREGFRGMVAFAESHGWLDSTGRLIRAHVARN